MSDTLTLPSATLAALPVGWRTVRFGDVVRNVDEHERQPLERGIDRYVGLEHIDPESLHIKRWGDIADGTSFTRTFSARQVLFGKRRAYQRKVAVAEFAGICSGDILVFEPKDDALLPELLPFIVQSEGFFQHALGTSAGSLSPRTRWRDLAEYAFALPPLDEQRRIAEILWAADEATELWVQCKDYLNNIIFQTASQIFQKHWPTKKLKDCVESSAYGPRFSNSFYATEGGVGCIRTTDLMEDGTIVYSTIPRADLEPDEYKSHILRGGDFLISRSGTCGIAAVYEETDIPMIPGAFLIRMRLLPNLNPYFLKEFINSSIGRLITEKLAQGGVQKNIRGSSLLEEEIPVPPIDDQDSIVIAIHKLQSGIKIIESQIKKLHSMKVALINNLLV